ncbi:MAG: DUF1080 domain-containing protein [Thermoguttaceae bacterium]
MKRLLTIVLLATVATTFAATESAWACKFLDNMFRRRATRSCRVTRCSADSQATKGPYQWQDLFDGKTLDGWKVTNFGGEGEVYVKDGTIVMEMGNYMSGITWTGQPPRENFEIQLEGMRLSGSDFFCTTTFPVGKDSCSFVVGGWGGSVTGLSNVDYYDAGDNSTTNFVEFKDNQWYRIRIRVSKEFIRAWVDDKQMVNQEREGHEFGIRNEVDLSRPLGICTWSTTGAVRNIQIRQIDPDAKEPDAKEPDPKEPDED